MKFLSMTAAALIAVLAFASPSFAESASFDDGWSGIFTRSELKVQSDGSVIMTNAEKGGPTRYSECKRFSSGHAGAGTYCRGDGSSPAGTQLQADVSTSHSNSGGCSNTATTTCYAVFNPRYMASGQVKNTEGRPQVVNQCKQAGSSKCIFVEAPLHNWKRANNIALDQTGWNLQRF